MIDIAYRSVFIKFYGLAPSGRLDDIPAVSFAAVDIHQESFASDATYGGRTPNTMRGEISRGTWTGIEPSMMVEAPLRDQNAAAYMTSRKLSCPDGIHRYGVLAPVFPA